LSDASARFTVEAIDKASDVVERIGSTVEDTGMSCEKVNLATARSTKDTLMAVNNLATSFMSAYNAIDSVKNAELAAEKAAITYRQAIENGEKAQVTYDEAVTKFGVDSTQAKQALDALNIAKDRASLADERARQSQENVSKSMMSAALTAIPTAMTAFTSLSTLVGSVGGSIGGLSSTMGGFASALPAIFTGPIGIALIAVTAAIGLAVWAWNSDFMGVRTGIQKMLADVTAATQEADRKLKATQEKAIETGRVTKEIIAGMESGKKKEFTEAAKTVEAKTAADLAATTTGGTTITVEKGAVQITGVVNDDMIAEVGETLAKKMQKAGIR